MTPPAQDEGAANKEVAERPDLMMTQDQQIVTDEEETPTTEQIPESAVMSDVQSADVLQSEPTKLVMFTSILVQLVMCTGAKLAASCHSLYVAAQF